MPKRKLNDFIVKTAPGSLVHGRPLLPFKVKVVVVKVIPGMGDEPLWKGNQGGADTLAETEGGYLVWPKYLMEEVTGDNCMVIDEVVNSELEQMAQAFAAGSSATSYLPLIALVVQTKYVGREKEGKWFNIRGVNQMDKTLSVRGARISFSLWEVAGKKLRMDLCSRTFIFKTRLLICNKSDFSNLAFDNPGKRPKRGEM
ncbi:hypothetical protein LguiA_012680 [Lonicera macranthoides]